jgi:ABC-type multidrug transport system fused ATPase/permease subunit
VVKSPYTSATLLGIAPAVKQSGRANDIYVMGGEGFEPELDLLRTDQGVSAVNIAPSDWTGWAAVDTMNSLFAGTEPVDSGWAGSWSTGEQPAAVRPVRAQGRLQGRVQEGLGRLMTASATAPVTSVLRVSNLSKAYNGVLALDGVDLDIRPGEVHALLGGNGSGKSTLIKVLAGVVDAEPGAVMHLGEQEVSLGGWTSDKAYDAGLRFVHQQPAVFADLSIAENIAFGTTFPRDAPARSTGRR